MKRFIVISKMTSRGPEYRILWKAASTHRNGLNAWPSCWRANPKEGKSRMHVKEICKNCGSCKPTYKGGICEKTGKKTKLSGTCEDWRPKR